MGPFGTAAEGTRRHFRTRSTWPDRNQRGRSVDEFDLVLVVEEPFLAVDGDLPRSRSSRWVHSGRSADLLVCPGTATNLNNYKPGWVLPCLVGDNSRINYGSCSVIPGSVLVWQLSAYRRRNTMHRLVNSYLVVRKLHEILTLFSVNMSLNCGGGQGPELSHRVSMRTKNTQRPAVR